MKRHSTTVRRYRAAASALGVGLVAVLCVLAVSACGSSSSASGGSTSSSTASTTTTTTSSGTTTTAGGGFAAYSACLQQHGVTFGAGGGFGGAGGGSGGTTTTRPTRTPAQQKAFTACASLQPAGGFGGGGFRGGSGGGFNSSNPAFAKFEACLKSHGVSTGSSADRTSSAYQTALAACRSLLPAGGFGGRGAGGGGGTNSTNPSFAKFQACLKQHGVVTGAAGQTPAKTQAALTACRSLLPNGGAGTPGTTTTPSTTTTAAG